MAAKTIAVANMKGGVGKTTLSIMIAEGFSALRKARVLVVDLDAQGSLSYALMGRERYEAAIRGTRLVTRFFDKKASGDTVRLSGSIVEQASLLPDCTSLDLAPADAELQVVERKVIASLTRIALDNVFRGAPEVTTARWLQQEINRLRSSYDWIVFDCPPGISIFAYAGITCSDAILMPMTPDYLSMQAIRTMNTSVLPLMGPRVQSIKKYSILNKCRAGVRAVAEYRAELLEANKTNKWGVELIDVQLPLRQKLADATESDEDRKWKSFGTKFDVENCEAILKILEK
ncbi:MAG: AAA family ATPase [Hyphomonadaceae bacterium]